MIFSGGSKKAWLSSQTFYSYACNTFLPNCQDGLCFLTYMKQKGVKFPILDFLDGHKSDLTYKLSKFLQKIEFSISDSIQMLHIFYNRLMFLYLPHRKQIGELLY